ncbi:MAG: S9 family peptidase [Fimbriimonadaceae bacterium]|nr:MAG: S9 family peptidase [Fimbriimonadaceae bacterium]
MISALIASTMIGQNFKYPVTKTVDHTDTYHGITVKDPYRWLEQPISTPEVKKWADAQNKLTFDYLHKIPNSKPLLDELLHRVNYERYTVPTQRGDRTFYFHNTGLQAQDVLFVIDKPGAKPRVLLDPNTFSKDGTVALNATDFSNDGTRMLYGVSASGSDWIEWKVMDVATGKDLGTGVKWSKFGGGTINADGTGFYYLRYPEPKAGSGFVDANVDASIYFHKVGTQQSEDLLIYKDSDNPSRFLFPVVTDDKSEVLIYVSDPGSINNRLYWIKMNGVGQPQIVKLHDKDDAGYSFLGKRDGMFYFQTDLNAPNGRVIRMKPEVGAKLEEVVRSRPEAIESVSLLKSQIVVGYMKDAHAVPEVFDLNGKSLHKVKLPGLGTVSGFGSNLRDGKTYYSYVDLTTPATIYSYDAATNNAAEFRKPVMPMDTSKYVSKQVFVRSSDGKTRVPMYIVHRKDLKINGDEPTLLYAYGGFASSTNPWFSTSRTVWMDMGGIWCLANIRGGAEYGKSWHEAATKVRRQNAYDDFIACAEWLVKNNYTKPKRLAIKGESNGGLLIGAVMNQRPDLYGVCLPGVGVMDMLRFNKFTIGSAWEGDYGSPENQDEFFALYRISPYHNLRPNTIYPATLVTTADTDDRVVPAHSFKYAARLQACQAGPAPVLIRIETSAGHGGGKPIQKVMEEVRDEFSFTMHNMGVKIPAKF